MCDICSVTAEMLCFMTARIAVLISLGCLPSLSVCAVYDDDGSNKLITLDGMMISNFL